MQHRRHSRATIGANGGSKPCNHRRWSSCPGLAPHSQASQRGQFHRVRVPSQVVHFSGDDHLQKAGALEGQRRRARRRGNATATICTGWDSQSTTAAPARWSSRSTGTAAPPKRPPRWTTTATRRCRPHKRAQTPVDDHRKFAVHVLWSNQMLQRRQHVTVAQLLVPPQQLPRHHPVAARYCPAVRRLPRHCGGRTRPPDARHACRVFGFDVRQRVIQRLPCRGLGRCQTQRPATGANGSQLRRGEERQPNEAKKRGRRAAQLRHRGVRTRRCDIGTTTQCVAP